MKNWFRTETYEFPATEEGEKTLSRVLGILNFKKVDYNYTLDPDKGRFILTVPENAEVPI